MNFLKKLFASPDEPTPETLLEAPSPTCPLTAFVEQDGRTAYLYLTGNEGSNFGVRACWVRNLRPAPEGIVKADLDKGFAPLQPAAACHHPRGMEPLTPDNLYFVWLEEGDGVALFARDALLAVIPSWAASDGFPGYAREAIGDGAFAWALLPAGELIDRVMAAGRFWSSWDDEPTPFQAQQPAIMDAYDELFGTHTQYFAIDGNAFPPRGMYVRNGPTRTMIATVCTSLLPLPQVELYTDHPSTVNRVEFGLLLDTPLSEEGLSKVGSSVSGLAGIPWRHVTPMGEGHTVSFTFPEGSAFTSVVLTNHLDCLPPVDLGTYRGSPINFLWMIPITERERVELGGEGAAPLIAALNRIGEEVYSLGRGEVV